MAFVLSSISGNLISAASAGFAPTNKADVSAIASAYQVVSATATQLYAGTAYVTSVNGSPLSASRAGNAANASLASSAWYDGTGRLISSLPDSAAVSAIASAYAQSAASGKQDSLTFAYDADSAISSINGSALAGQGGGGMITSIQSARNPWWQTSISGLNGSSLYPNWAESAETARNAVSAGYATEAGSAGAAPTAWASSFITGVSSPSGTIRVLGGTAIESTNSAVMPSTVIEGFSTSFGGATIGPGVKANYVFPTANPSTEIIVSLSYNPGVVLWSSDNGIEGSQEKDTAPETITVQVPNATAVDIWSDSWIPVNSVTASAANQEIGGGVAELAWASALPTYSYDAEDKISAINGSAIAGGGGGATGDYVEKSATEVTIGSANVAYDVALTQGINTYANGASFAQGYNATAVAESFAQGLRISAQNTSFAQGYQASAYENSIAVGCQVSAINTAIAMGRFNKSGDGSGSSGAAFVIGDGTAYAARHDLMVVTKDGEITMYSGTADTTGTGIMSSIRALSANAGGVDSATVSAIASSYAESAVSSYQPLSGMSGYALSADVSGTVDLVSTQSANWGGSALALSAGPGVSLSKSGDTLTVSTETVLWSGTPVTVANATAGLPLAESPYNFDRVALYWVPWNYTVNSLAKQEAVAEAKITSAIPRIGSVTEWNAEASNTMFIFVLNAYFDSSKFYTQAIKYFSIGDWSVNVNGNDSYITKIVGINRTAEA